MSIVIANGCEAINIILETTVILNFPASKEPNHGSERLGEPTHSNQRSDRRKLIPRLYNNWQRCPHCTYKSRFLGNLNNHVKSWHSRGRKRKGKFEWHEYYQCAHCQYESRNKQPLQNHMMARHCEQVNKECPKCHVILKNQMCLNSHLQYCGKAADHRCEHCPFRTRYKNHLKRHLANVHTDNRSIECPNRCGSVLKNKESLRGHLNFCGSELFSVQCRYCSFRPKRKNLLQLHVARAHNDLSNITNQCPKCTKKFKKKAYLKKHVPICDSKRVFQCAACSYTFHKKALLEKHILQKHLHRSANDKFAPYSHCPRCHTGFKHQTDLSEHLVRCGHEVRFQCYHCPFKTQIKDQLKNHILCAHIESNEFYQINMRNYIESPAFVDVPFHRL
ncbi:zinc finger Y-chromosomal protein-like [Phymastichus coffea]|uniref:zinc finger Y-chromosomal protein-like n=1 Tax=Phymastichus coffea TaxID=108790 RepID=UPI00273ACC63|nr:zinc finger Y-chromosomal protein-like [Phymastichus coffea]